MSTLGHLYRMSWHNGLRCYCHDMTDADIAAFYEPARPEPTVCVKCGYPVSRSWGGYGHAAGYQGKRHVVVPA